MGLYPARVRRTGPSHATQPIKDENGNVFVFEPGLAGAAGCAADRGGNGYAAFVLGMDFVPGCADLSLVAGTLARSAATSPSWPESLTYSWRVATCSRSPPASGWKRRPQPAALLAFNLAAWFASAAFEQRLLMAARTRPAKLLLTILSVCLVPLGLIEMACRLLTDVHVLKYNQAIHTVWRSGHDDWRLATITSDACREPDPVLLWRPLPRKPFNSQRFKGPVVQVPKPTDVVRIMCYGDSLTDGPPKGGWPSWLHALLREQPPVAGRSFEVINAGVAGYSSHQGLLRFLEEVDQYQPDLLLVSFGWNDAAEAVGQPDKSFQIPPWPIVQCQRALVRYRAYLVLQYYTRQWRAEPPVARPGSFQPRVSIDDYLANLDRFRDEAQRRGIPIVFLTRAHKVPPAELSQNPTWRGTVPRYNAALTAWATDQMSR